MSNAPMSLSPVHVVQTLVDGLWTDGVGYPAGAPWPYDAPYIYVGNDDGLRGAQTHVKSLAKHEDQDGKPVRERRVVLRTDVVVGT